MPRIYIFKTRIITIGVLTLITGFLWIAFDVYHSYTENKITPDVQRQIEPLNPKLQTAVLDQLVSRRDININFDLPYPYIDDSSSSNITTPPSRTLEFAQPYEPETTPDIIQ